MAVDQFLHLKNLDPTLSNLRDVARLVTGSELDFLRLYEHLFALLIKKEGLEDELKAKVFDVLEGINQKQIKVLAQMSNSKVAYVRKKTVI